MNKHDIFHVFLSLGARQCKLKNNSVLLDFQKTLDIKTVDLMKFVAVTSCKSITHIEVQTKVYDIWPGSSHNYSRSVLALAKMLGSLLGDTIFFHFIFLRVLQLLQEHKEVSYLVFKRSDDSSAKSRQLMCSPWFSFPAKCIFSYFQSWTYLIHLYNFHVTDKNKYISLSITKGQSLWST